MALFGLWKKKKKKKPSPAANQEVAPALPPEAQQPTKLWTVTALFLILLSVFLFAAFTSFLFTWQADQSEIYEIRNFWKFITGSGIEVQNWLGRVGAVFSHMLFFKGFGVASFVFPYLLALFGIKMLFGLKRIFTFRHIFNILFILFWLPPALHFLPGSAELPWGGAVGSFVAGWLAGFTGKFGTLGLLAFAILFFMVFNFNLNFRFKKTGKKEDDEAAAPPSMLQNQWEDNHSAGSDPLPENAVPAIELAPEQNDTAQFPDPAPEETGREAESAGKGQVALDIAETTEEKLAEGDTAVVTNYDPTLDLPDYNYPPLDLLQDYGADRGEINKEELEQNKDQIVRTLGNYSIGIERIKAMVGPTVTLYEIVPNAGTRISKIKNLEDDIALSLSALGIRIIAPMPGRGTIGIEVPNQKKETVSIRSMLASERFQQTKMDLPVVMGKTISNENYLADLTRMPHLLIAGATGQGKSVAINALLLSMLYKKHPSQLKFVLVDPKKVELVFYKNIDRHFLAKLPGEEESIVTDIRKVIYTINSLCVEMDQRYNLLQKASVRNIKEYNTKFVARHLNPRDGHRFLPYIVLVVDEFADLIMTAGKEVENPITRLAQLARAIGIHLIIATQRPSVNIITGTIKANFPARMAFKVTSKVDSRTILDTSGADQLVGRGDMLFAYGSEIIRLQGPFVDTPEVENVTRFIGSQKGYPDTHSLPEYHDESAEAGEGFDPNERDEFFEEAARLIVQSQQGSTSLLQRKLKLGYNRAGRLMDQLESAGIVGSQEGSKPREVKLKTEYELERFLQDMGESSS